MNQHPPTTQGRARRGHARRMGIALLLLAQLAIVLSPRPARAEGFVEPAFGQQWRATDEAVARGTASRTFFWGPEPFAHTNEVYQEASGTLRRVQYFDKARMELTRRAGQDPNLVTNGLLTVELVTGRLQVGDTAFLRRDPASNPVAGDPLHNEQAPTYASFSQGRLAFGVPGAAAAPDRTGQRVVEAINRAGELSTLPQPPQAVTYAGYFRETGHNVADVFQRFFRQPPLGETAWLPVMGYPISEPFWARDKAVVGGQPRDVLIQLFERRALTYTPSNPAGFQVEMGNIGQHYFLWRYNLDPRDRLPGNFRLIHAQGNAVYSRSIRNTAGTIKLADAPAAIANLWTVGDGRALVATAGGPYLVDLAGARPPQALPRPASLGQAGVEEVSSSADGRLVAVRYRVPAASASVVQAYELGASSGDRLEIRDTWTAYEGDSTGLRLSHDGAYILLHAGRGITIVHWAERRAYQLPLDDRADITGAEWIGRSHRLLASAGGFDTFDPATGMYSNTPGAVYLVDAPPNQGVVQVLAGPGIRAISVSPDGNYFALRSSKGPFVPGSSSNAVVNTVSFRAIAEPGVELAPAYEQGSIGRNSHEPRLGEWSTDGTYIVVRSGATLTAGAFVEEANLVSPVTGRPIQQNRIEGGNLSTMSLRLAGPFYILAANHIYRGPEADTLQSIVVRNLDGSEQTELFSASVRPNVENNDLPVRTARVTQVVQP